MNEKEENLKNNSEQQKDKLLLVSITQIYCDRDKFKLYIANKEETKLKDVVSLEIKNKENEVKLIDILYGNIKTNIDARRISDLRQYFRMRKQIGFGNSREYDFIYKSDLEVFYKLSVFQNIQNSKLQLDDLIIF